jgi:hypothetical protein
MGFGQAFVAEAITKAFKSGGEKFIEELAESLPTEHLESLLGIATRILEKRKNTINAKAG